MQRVSHYRQVSEARVPDSSVYTMAPPVQCFDPSSSVVSSEVASSPGSRRLCTRVACARQRNRSAQVLQHRAAHHQLTVRVWRHTCCPEERSPGSDPSSSVVSSEVSSSPGRRRLCTRVACARERNRSAQVLQHRAAHHQLTVRVRRHTCCPERSPGSDPSSSVVSSEVASSPGSRRLCSRLACARQRNRSARQHQQGQRLRQPQRRLRQL